MWILTPRGFYSAVQKFSDGDEMVTVRARSKRDLENLRDLLPDAEFYAPQAAWADYPCRLRCTQDEWAGAVAAMAREVSYDNFKDEIGRVQGKKRAGIYSRVWSTLLEIEGAKAWSQRWRSWDDALLSSSGGLDLDALPGERLDAALAEVDARSDADSPPRRKQAKKQARRRASRGRSR